ncbi:AmmeMemoRadiSam system protein B [Pleomorphochaeta sp. DL1XJH-081]|uniref:AmmeMemoRadiSam system protein B n=1 Tax=Pleomorphochaeta sp. DL1XJH-081 TaxID=3409690 RepID=UPI003BB6C01F
MVTEGMPSMRKAWYAGTWYAAEPDSLRSTIETAISQVEENNDGGRRQGPVRFAVLPHAGLAYSARGLAHLVSLAPEKIERVLILSPSHNSVLPENTLSFGQFSGYETPLGALQAFKTGLESHGPDVTHAIQREHAVEMVLPFLAYLQKRQKSPISVAMALVSHVTEASHAMKIADDLFSALGEHELESESTMVIASSDFTHYGKRFGHAPYGVHVDSTVARKVEEDDLSLATALARTELGPVYLKQRMGRLTVCGIAAAAIVSALGRRVDTTGWIADYYTSLDVMGDHATDFVAYCSIVWR